MPEEPAPLTLDGLAAYITAWGASIDPTEDAEAASAGWSALEGDAEEWASSHAEAELRRRRAGREPEARDARRRRAAAATAARGAAGVARPVEVARDDAAGEGRDADGRIEGSSQFLVKLLQLPKP